MDRAGKIAELPVKNRLSVRPEEAAQILSLGRAKLFELLATGEISSFTVGRARMVPIKAIEDFVERRVKADKAERGVA